MDVVRFSIIENEMNWEEEYKIYSERNQSEVDDEDGYERSISSEGDVPGVQMSSSNQQNDYNSREEQQEIWEFSEIESALREFPNADKICDIITSNAALDEEILTNNITDINTALLFSVWYNKHLYASRLLTAFNADPNAEDYYGRSALHLSCYVGDPVITKLLLNWKANPHKWDKERKATPLHCAASSGNCECVQLLLVGGVDINAGIDKFSALHYAVQRNNKKCVEVLLNNGANPNTPQVYTQTPLHVASAAGYTDCIRLLLKFGADVRSQYGQKKITALHLSASENYLDCVRLLLEAGANIDARNKDNQTPLHLACLSQCHETLKCLIQHGADVHAIYRDGRTALHASIVKESRFWDCTLSLLQAKVDVNKSDNFGYTPLHIAALNEFSTCAFLLIEYGADITARTNGGVSALSFIIRRTPEIIPKYINKLDTAISVNSIHEIGDVDCEIRLDFRLLVPNNERGETELLLAFIEVGQKRILKHPLCETFLFLKWRRIRKFFLFSLFYHALFVLMFTIFILAVYVKDCPSRQRTNATSCTPPHYVIPIGYIVLFLNLVLLTKEIFQMAHGFLGYMRYWENWLQWSIIIGVFLCSDPQGLLTGDLTLLPNWQHHVAGIVIFLVWLELMMLVGRFPIFGLYVQMFQTVAVNFSKFLMAYSCLLVAFGLSFGVLFANYPAFKEVPQLFPGRALLKTMVMMAGELEFEDIFYGSNRIDYPGTAHAMFLAFVILITVILTNLLVGLAVSDIQGLQVSAGLDRLLRQAELVSRLEGLMFSKLLRKAPLRLLALFQRIALLRTSRCRLQFRIKPNDPRENRIPKELITSIYKLVAERRERNQSVRKHKKRRNLNIFNDSVEQRKESVQLRHPKLRNFRYRTVSEHPYDLNLNLNDEVTLRNDQNNSFPQQPSRDKSKIQKIISKIEENQSNIMKKLDNMSQDIIALKNKLKKM